ncbi:MAG: Trm112 family protein [Bacteroidota bacterium]
MLNQELLNILVCPVGKSELRLEGSALVCTSCGAKYRIEDDIPIMLVEEAELPAGVTSADQLKCGI